MRVARKYDRAGGVRRQVRDATDEYAHPAIDNCESVEYLRAAVRVEANSDARQARIAYLNERIDEVEA